MSSHAEHNGNGTHTYSVPMVAQAKPTLFQGMTFDEWMQEKRQETEERIQNLIEDLAPHIKRIREGMAEREICARRGYLAHRLLTDAGFKPDHYNPTNIDVNVEALELPRVAQAIGPFKVTYRNLVEGANGQDGEGRATGEAQPRPDMVKVTCTSTDYPEVSIHYLAPLEPGSKCKVRESVSRYLACDI